MLKHFVDHVTDGQGDKSTSKWKKTPIPDLYPIKTRKILKNKADSNENKHDNEENIDSGFEDLNPIKFCQVTMEDKKNGTIETAPSNDAIEKNILTGERSKMKRYNCDYCSKSFGWSTDLKRHLLIHTGERPYKCEYCKLSFTRNFLLQKHRLKYHGDKDIFFSVTKMNIPTLKPLEISVKHKPRKQDKCNIKRKMCSTKAMYQSNVKTLICSI